MSDLCQTFDNRPLGRCPSLAIAGPRKAIAMPESWGVPREKRHLGGGASVVGPDRRRRVILYAGTAGDNELHAYWARRPSPSYAGSRAHAG